MGSALPSGFELEAPPSTGADLPPGFEIETSPPALAASAQQSDPMLDAVFRSNPITAGVDAGLRAVGTSGEQVVSQGLSGFNADLAHTVDLPKMLLSAGPAIVNLFTDRFGGPHINGPDYIPDFGDAIEGSMKQAGMVKPPSDNPIDKLARSTGSALGGAIVPEVGLEAAATKGAVKLADLIKGLAPAATAGAGGGVADVVAPDNPGAHLAGELIGGVVPTTALSGMRAAMRPKYVTDTGQPVPRKLVQAVERDQVPIDQVAARVADISPAATVADLGDNTQKLAMGIATQPGKAGASISNALRERAADSTNRVPAAVNDVLGPASPPSAIKADIKGNMEVVGPEYDQVLAKAGPVDPMPLAAALDAKIATLKGPARAALQEVRGMLNVAGADASDIAARLDTTASGLFETRNALDGMISSTTNSKVNGALIDARQQIDAMLEKAAPGIKDIDAKYRELARQRDAVGDGASVLDGGKSAIWPQENAATIAEGVQPQGNLVGPSAAAFRLRQGTRADIERIIGTKLNDRVALAQMVQGESDWNFRKLAQLYGDEKAGQIMKLVDGERRMAETENMARAGSKTAAATAAQKDLEGDSVLSDVVRAGGWSPQNAAFAGMARGIKSGMSALNRRGNDQIADIIMGRGAWNRSPNKPLISPSQQRGMSAAMMSAIMRPVGQ